MFAKFSLLVFLSTLISLHSTFAIEKNFLPKKPIAVRNRLRGLFGPNEVLPPIKDNFSMLTYMEQRKNQPMFMQSTDPSTLKMGAIPKDRFDIDLMPRFPKSIASVFSGKIDGKEVIFTPVHPQNQDDSVLGMDIINQPNPPQNTIRDLTYQNLASRSKLALGLGLRGPIFGLKMATDHILPTICQPGKMDLTGELCYSIDYSKYFNKKDLLIGKDPSFDLIREKGVYRLKTDPDEDVKGFIIRDMKLLQNGDVYIPAFSIPYVGRNLANYHGKDFKDYWYENYAYPLGQAKAKLALRYGMQMLTPNSQNILLRFDQDLKFKGIVFRDITDNHFLSPIMDVVDPQNELYQSEKENNDIKKYLFPYSSNSTWKFDEAPGELRVDSKTVDFWDQGQCQGYLDTFNEVLGTKLEPLPAKSDPQITEYKQIITDEKHHYKGVGSEEDLRFIVPIFKYLQTEIGQKKLKNYHQELIMKAKIEKGRNKRGREEIANEPGRKLPKILSR